MTDAFMADPERWQRIKQLFRDAQTVPSGERSDWLARQDGDAALLDELRRLLSAQQVSHGILESDAAAALQRMGTTNAAVDLSGTRIGSLRLLRLIGEGGMGSVYLAERDGGDFVQRVALKLVRADFAGPEARERFLRERSFLARLVHPHIAQFHDGGLTADGSPYFTLEYVEGEPITTSCDARRLGPAPTHRTGASGLRGGGLCASQPDRASGPQAFEHSGKRRRRGEAARLRHRQVARPRSGRGPDLRPIRA
jgi:serine/threonine-protein kinase